MRTGMKDDLSRFFPIAEAISILLFPHIEVVVHNTSSGRIAAIYNNLSKRKVGDESLLDDMGDFNQYPDVFPLYYKTNWDGQKMKSVTATLRDKNKKPIGLLCINLDLSKWEEMHSFVLGFIQSVEMPQPKELFKNDWREKINVFVTEFLKKENCSLKTLSKEKKQELVCTLHNEGAFREKNAAAYIADVLNLSRATIYNYLKVTNHD